MELKRNPFPHKQTFGRRNDITVRMWQMKAWKSQNAIEGGFAWHISFVKVAFKCFMLCEICRAQNHTVKRPRGDQETLLTGVQKMLMYSFSQLHTQLPFSSSEPIQISCLGKIWTPSAQQLFVILFRKQSSVFPVPAKRTMCLRIKHGIITFAALWRSSNCSK